MSKLTKTESKPAYIGGTASLNGVNKATTSAQGDNIVANYNMSDKEKALYDYAQNTLAEIVPEVNVFSDKTWSNIQSQLESYKKQGQQTIDSLYSPMINNLKNDIASRFGNFDNSMFMDKLNNIEQNRANSMSTFANDILAKQNDLINNELANRYNFINLLNGLQNQTNNTALNFIAAALNASGGGNNLNKYRTTNSGMLDGFSSNDISSIMNLMSML